MGMLELHTGGTGATKAHVGKGTEENAGEEKVFPTDRATQGK